jgi:PIN domain nuclease of toxin-antitoxin system
MKYIIDTHAFLFTVFNPQKLSKKTEKIILNIENSIYISSITFWEISLKYNLGKLSLQNVYPDELPEIAGKIGLIYLPLNCEEASSFYKLLKAAHKDPFDRMLIWQTIKNNMILISKDSSFKEYFDIGLHVVW